MEIKNSFEIIVDEVLDGLLRNRKDICFCERCRLDMKAYALNRLPPRYLVGERGLTHSILNSVQDAQANADAVRIVSEAIRAIGSRPRPGHGGKKSRSAPGKTEYNFPHIVGQVYRNLQYDPAIGAKVLLLDAGKKAVRMRNPGWPNPVTLPRETLGIFNFWPESVATRPSGKSRVFSYSLDVRLGRRRMIQSFRLTIKPGSSGRNIVRIPPVVFDADD